MRAHVAMIVGGLGIDILPHTIRHYQTLGISSFYVVIHQRQPDDSLLNYATSLVRSCGLEVESIVVDDDFPACQHRNFQRLMAAKPDEWFLPIDCDEFQRYPGGIREALAHCERLDYDHIHGCLIDRVSADGVLKALQPDSPIWEQYPLGAVLTYPLFGGDPRKIVAAKGRVVLSSGGHHGAFSSAGCPVRELYVPVHHFKWVQTLIPYLESRRDLFTRSPCQGESDRCVEYFAQHGKIDLNDPRLMVAPCSPEYPYWNRVRDIVFDTELAKRNPRSDSAVFTDGMTAV